MSVLRLLAKTGRSLTMHVTVTNADGDSAPTHVLEPGNEHTVEVPSGGFVTVTRAADGEPAVAPAPPTNHAAPKAAKAVKAVKPKAAPKAKKPAAKKKAKR